MAVIATSQESGLSAVYAIIRNSSGSVWNGSAFVTYVEASRAVYALAATEQGQSGYYSVSIPAGITTSGSYTFTFYQQVGGSAATGDYILSSGNFVVNAASSSTTLTGNNSAAYTAQLNVIDEKINELISNPRPNYTVGNTRMDFGDLLETLYGIREKILNKLSSLDSESFETINTDINQFGQDIADYVNEVSQ